MKIGELARSAGTAVETIRYYERQGLMPQAGRTPANYRVYGEGHAQRLAFIRHCRCLDMTLDDIRALLRHKDAPEEDCAAVDSLLDQRIQQVARRISELEALENDLRALRSSCADGRTAANCGILGGLERAARTHKHGPAKPADNKRSEKATSRRPSRTKPSGGAQQFKSL
jgi:Cd(II)/Pb(II)-responsive transcriptional regulator